MNILPEQFFAALSHPIRLRCLLLLHRHEELCVCELTQVVGAAQPTMSRHLGQLRALGLVADRRDGLWIHYRIASELPVQIRRLLDTAASELSALSPFKEDAATLEGMPLHRSDSRCA